MTTRVAVVGGGLAGITAALHCADAGAEVTLLEARPRLGGLTASFSRHGELVVDTGQHVFLRCCTAYLDLLHRLGVADQVTLQDRLDVPVLTPGRDRADHLRAGRLPAPLHLAGSLLRYGPLAPVDRLRAARAALALRRVDPADPEADARTFGDWLARHGQRGRAVTALWDLIGTATLNLPAAEASLAAAATVFQVGLLTDARAADLGWSARPLGELHGAAAAARLAAAGVDVRTAQRAWGLRRAGREWRVGSGAGEVPADGVVVAVPPRAAERLLPAGSLTLAPGWSRRLGRVPIVNVHVRYDRKVTDLPFFAALESPVQWVFDRTAPSGLRSGQYLAVSLSAADWAIGVRSGELTVRIVAELARLLPAAGAAGVVDAFVTREPEATFRAVPGTAALRPGPATAVAGLAVAGAWTATGWPDTMEGAVRSGAAAAATVLAGAARPVQLRREVPV